MGKVVIAHIKLLQGRLQVIKGIPADSLNTIMGEDQRADLHHTQTVETREPIEGQIKITQRDFLEWMLICPPDSVMPQVQKLEAVAVCDPMGGHLFQPVLTQVQELDADQVIHNNVTDPVLAEVQTLQVPQPVAGVEGCQVILLYVQGMEVGHGSEDVRVHTEEAVIWEVQDLKTREGGKESCTEVTQMHAAKVQELQGTLIGEPIKGHNQNRQAHASVAWEGQRRQVIHALEGLGINVDE